MARVSIKEAGDAFKAIRSSKNGRVVIKWLLQELGLYENLSSNDARAQEGNVARHDFAVRIVKLLETKEK